MFAYSMRCGEGIQVSFPLLNNMEVFFYVETYTSLCFQLTHRIPALIGTFFKDQHIIELLYQEMYTFKAYFIISKLHSKKQY